MAPSPIETAELTHPAVSAHLAGLRILHIADLHIRRPLGERSALAQLIDAMPWLSVDLVLLTGDFMHRPGHETAAIDVLRRIIDAADASLGIFGVFGNHDSAGFQTRACELPGVQWLLNQSVRPSPGLRLVGASYPEDMASAILDGNSTPGELVLGLCHYPNEIIPASELGVHLLFAGHTHGGQWRLTKRLAPHTSCDLPRHHASGVLRYRNTLCVISRGLGEAIFEQRINCRRQAPLITVCRGAHMGRVDVRSDEINQVIAW